MATEAVSHLNDLIKTDLDGKLGYQQAAQNVNDGSLKTLFTDYATQRSQFASELQSAVRSIGGTPTDDSSVSSAFHRGWLGLKDAIRSGDGAVLKECVRGDEHAVKEYQKVLSDDDVPAEAKTVIARQHGEIEQALAKINQLKASYA